jgi:hypothetical protein
MKIIYEKNVSRSSDFGGLQREKLLALKVKIAP